MNTGAFVRTDSTGTVSLVFLAEGTTPVRISRPGYKDLELPVEIAATATTGLTLLLEHAPR